MLIFQLISNENAKKELGDVDDITEEKVDKVVEEFCLTKIESSHNQNTLMHTTLKFQLQHSLPSITKQIEAQKYMEVFHHGNIKILTKRFLGLSFISYFQRVLKVSKKSSRWSSIC